MEVHFSKYHGTGNDFILIDGVGQDLTPIKLDIPALCDRHFGIGADGLIVIQQHPELDFHMIYYNSDGSQSFCGNGSRCAVAFARTLGMVPEDGETMFLSTDGVHHAQFLENGEIRLSMADVDAVERRENHYILQTGSPHYIIEVDDPSAVDIIPEAHKIRYSDAFRERGINVNFVHFDPDGVRMRTYERGVEDETLSCGTGVTASALAWHVVMKETDGAFNIPVSAPGGNLRVQFDYLHSTGYSNIFLQGPALRVFDGVVVCD
ncbi:MAG: diaminopimelate epimerase [Flavobacteriales bacterium]|nr:diaminopimelate epimerase [Bacteroidota bacterium]MCB9240542.1 diaminopimelate epimerase [Flavobacteriales bacterium]